MTDCTIKLNASNLDGKIKVNISSQSMLKEIAVKVTYPSSCETWTLSGCPDANTFEGIICVENPKLWTVNEPNLYKYEAVVTTEEGVYSKVGKIGFRTLSTGGKNIYLNDKPIFIKGYIRGAKAHEHSNNCALTQIDFYRKNIRQAKKYGFNMIRFHSTVPEEALFEAADELGMLVHIEFRDIGDAYDNLSEMRFMKHSVADEQYIKGIIDKYFNHPSLAVYCLGNELKSLNNPEAVGLLGKMIKEYDGTRLFVDTCAWGAPNRENVDIDVQHMSYFFPFGTHKNMFSDLSYFHVLPKDCKQNPFRVPVIAHEVCHYTALRDYKTLKKKFIKYDRELPWWVDEELKMIKVKGLQDCYDRLYAASKAFQFDCWKEAFEALRRSDIIGGFHFLQFADTDVYENSNGIVDCFDDDACFTAEQFKDFNADTVISADIADRNISLSSSLSYPVYLSDYGDEDLSCGDFIYCLQSTSGEKLVEGSFAVSQVEKGTNRIADVDISISVDSPQKLILQIEYVKSGKRICKNSYELFVHGQKERYSYHEFVGYRDGDTVVTDDIAKALNELEDGKKVCLVYRSDFTRHLLHKDMTSPEYAFKATWNRFKPVIWDRGTNYGGLVDSALLNKYGFITDERYGFNFSVLTEDCDKIILDDFPVPVKSIISGTDKSCRDRFDATVKMFNQRELQYDRTLRNFSYAFELKVGSGSLLVTGMNFKKLDENEPSCESMANALIAYLKSADFHPKNSIEIGELRRYMKNCAEKPVKERMMTQFWQLNDSPVESQEYWKESRKYLE